MMEFYSTKNSALRVDLKTAVLKGLAPDGGLFMPVAIPEIKTSILSKLKQLRFQEIAFHLAETLLQGSLPSSVLKNIIDDSINFDAPAIKLNEQLYSLELYHGPTLSFKDFGARFMARLMAYLIREDNREIQILTATSGDTGSAVAHGFLNIPGIKVWILYPKGQVSPLQEKQLTTVGQNVTAIEVEGSFDDCQALVKQAFTDPDLESCRLSSANSINIARLIPQSFYYAYGYAQVPSHHLVFSVPSGNFGNLTAGLIAKKMGIPIEHFIAATNINDTVPLYLKLGKFLPKASRRTLSNAMDVGNPSNFARIEDLYENFKAVKKEITGQVFSDEQTILGMQELYNDFNYISDPHGAIGYLGVKQYLKYHSAACGIFLETAHPAKFIEVVESALRIKIPLPEALELALHKQKHALCIEAKYSSLKALLSK